jgi:beta-aspartyl-peptidase (threonine type)
MGRVWLLVAFLSALLGCGTDGKGITANGASSSDSERIEWALAIHGGAGTIQRSVGEEVRRGYLDSLRQALTIGRTILEEGGDALDAVEKVVIHLEDDPHFNAGKGAVYNHDGAHELDAAIMDGRALACGAVTGVKTVKNPIILARKVMETTRHVLFAGDGAERFADTAGVERVDNAYFDTKRRREQWREHLDRRGSDLGTAGVVALDRSGNLAAGTSTGGLTGKMFGRVGDTPIFGAGTYANNSTCAISGTGTGEEFMRHNVAVRISTLMEYRGLPLQAAAEEVVHRILKPGDGGIIGVDREGHLALVFNSEGMFRGAADSSGRFDVAIWD